MTYKSKFLGLKIVVKPERKGFDKHGNPTKEDGVYIKFVKGEYKTDDKKMIDYLEDYMKRWQGEIVKIDEKELEHRKEVQKRVEAELAKERDMDPGDRVAKKTAEIEEKTDFEAEEKAAKEAVEKIEKDSASEKRKAAAAEKKEAEEQKLSAAKYERIRKTQEKKQPKKVSERHNIHTVDK